jgi:hypothetical protein
MQYWHCRKGEKSIMRFKNFHGTSIALLTALALLVSCEFQATVVAQDPDQPILLSAVFGLARDQSVRLTVLMPEGPAGIAHVKLFDGLGNSVAQTAEVRIPGGLFHSFHFDPADIHLVSEESTGRRQLRASCWIRVGGPWARRASATLEIIEASSGITDGASNTFLVGEHCLGCPQVGPLGDLGNFSFGIVPGQSVRFSVFNSEEANSNDLRGKLLRITVKSGDVFGREVAVSRGLTILPGQFAWASFDYDDLTIEPENRTGRKQALFKLFAAVVKAPSPSVQPIIPPGTLLVTGEAVNNDTGKTVVGTSLVHDIRPPGL